MCILTQSSDADGQQDTECWVEWKGLPLRSPGHCSNGILSAYSQSYRRVRTYQARAFERDTTQVSEGSKGRYSLELYTGNAY